MRSPSEMRIIEIDITNACISALIARDSVGIIRLPISWNGRCLKRVWTPFSNMGDALE